MTPKEKAEELVEYYAETIEPIQFGVILERNWKSAKQCALIAVDEILSFIEDDRDGFNWKTYYKEVKQEIEKL
jgi:hypothetical protein